MDPHCRPTRSSPRHRRRLRVTFLQATSFTSDVGPGGFSTERARVFGPGMTVEGTICAADGEFPFQGRIAWARPGDLTLNLRGRMGVEFTRVAGGLHRLLEPASRPAQAPGIPRS